MGNPPVAITRACSTAERQHDGGADQGRAGEKSRTGQGQAEGKRGAGRFVTAARRSGEA